MAVGVTVLVAGGLVACSTQIPARPAQGTSSPSVSAPVMAEPGVLSIDVGKAPFIPFVVDWAINVDDMGAVVDASPIIVSGVVTRVIGTEVDELGVINTIFGVRVDEVYKGNLASGEEINVRLPGGAMTMGDYIAALDSLGIYDQIFPVKSPEFLEEHGIDPDDVKDARSQDPAAPVIHNHGSNPTSASVIAEIDPDAWVFLLDQDAVGSYHATFLNLSLMYLKSGAVIRVVPGEQGQRPLSLPEEEFRALAG